jgi:glutaredoxin
LEQVSFLEFEKVRVKKKFKPILSLEERPKKVVKPFRHSELLLLGVKIKKGMNMKWCPYCAKVTKFSFDGYLGVRRCVYCGISDNDYYVKLANQTQGRKRKKAKKK